MAWRNVWRNRRRTLVTITAMSLALFVLLLYAALFEGYLRDMERAVLDYEVGDVQVFAGDYRDNPSIYTMIEDPERLLAPLRAAGFPATGRLLAYGLAAAGDSSAGVAFRGIDVARDAEVSLVHEQLQAGSWLSPDDHRGVVLGRRLARMLGAGPGDEVLVLSQGADGSMAYDLYTVRGVLRGIGDATDRAGVFMTAESFRELMVVPTGVHQIIARRPEGVPLPAAAARIHSVATDGYDVKTWRQLMPTAASMIDSGRQMITVMFLLVYLAVGILILNAVLMSVFERVREFGVMKALGAGPFDVVRMIFVENAIQAGIAILVAVTVGVPSLIYLSRVGIDLAILAGVSVMGIAMNPIWYAAITQTVFAGPIGTMLFVTFVAVLYPALKAARIEPVEAMHYR
jgi:ABC-type lipoprotein release transport system permease subunit